MHTTFPTGRRFAKFELLRIRGGFHLAGALFLLAGLILAVYHGLAQFEPVPALGWVSWSHIHFVTIGGFTQLLFGMLPQLTARKHDRPLPSKRYDWLNFVGLNGGFLLLWYGRGWGQVWAFDAGLAAIWLLVAGLLVITLRMVMQRDRAWDATIGLYLVSVFVFLWGITYAYGLFGHAWELPGGWLGLREAHVHANAWGFLGLAAIGTLYDLFPRILETDIYSERLRDYSAWFFVAGIFPLITGPWIGMGRTVTATGLVLFAVGFVLYLYNLVRTYRAAESRSGIALSVLVAQFWMLGPAGFVPFVLFGVEWVDPAYIEDGALHFFFLGWALPIALAGLLLYFRNLPALRQGRLGLADRVDRTDLLPHGAVPPRDLDVDDLALEPRDPGRRRRVLLPGSAVVDVFLRPGIHRAHPPVALRAGTGGSGALGGPQGCGDDG